MFKWSDRFNTRLESVDRQHRQLVELLNELYVHCRDQEEDDSVIDKALDSLCEYANQHFQDEEQLMVERGIDERHLSVHRMEHNSFVYDLERMRNHLSPDESLGDDAEKLVRFVTSWLTYHILGIDQVMAAQLRAISDGAPAEKAYDENRFVQQDAATMRILIDSLLDMWRDATERANRLEKEVAALRRDA